MKVLIIGLGSIGKKHVDSILLIDDSIELFALRSETNAKQYRNVKNIYDYKEIILEIDFIIISNITSLHRDTISKFLKFGKPLFIEKPVLESLKNSEILSYEIDKSEIFTYVACNLRFHPIIQYLKKNFLHNDIRINEVNVYCGSDLSKWRTGQDYKKSYSAFKECGGGVDLDLIHEIDYCVWLFSYPLRIHSLKSSKSSLNINSFDCARYNLEYENYSIAITLNYYRKDTRREIEILTDNDTFKFDLVRNEVVRFSDGKIIETFNQENTYLNQLKYFINCIRNKVKPMNDFNEAIQILKIALDEGNC